MDLEFHIPYKGRRRVESPVLPRELLNALHLLCLGDLLRSDQTLGGYQKTSDTHNEDTELLTRIPWLPVEPLSSHPRIPNSYCLNLGIGHVLSTLARMLTPLPWTPMFLHQIANTAVQMTGFPRTHMVQNRLLRAEPPQAVHETKGKSLIVQIRALITGCCVRTSPHNLSCCLLTTSPVVRLHPYPLVSKQLTQN